MNNFIFQMKKFWPEEVTGPILYKMPKKYVYSKVRLTASDLDILWHNIKHVDFGASCPGLES